ncbi:MAG: PilZ domain-containing protein [Candidatus Sulfotelmatobacter sp.]
MPARIPQLEGAHAHLLYSWPSKLGGPPPETCTMPPPPERRSDPRVKVKAPVEIFLEGNDVPLRTATADLSLHGCYIETFSPFPIGTVLELKLEANSTLLIQAEVVTKDPQVGNGIHFTKMLPEDIEDLKAFLAEAEKAEAEKSK